MTVADALALPPAPLQLSAYVVVALKAPVELEPEVERAPLQPPEAVQPVALLDDQFRVAAAPLATLPGVAVSVTVGAGVGGVTGVTVTVADALALPTAPLQLSA